ncbi:MAG: helix-turn-helix domain-containing protein [Dehalococcoidales bacterium]|nr:helix-turn-helix domain-containing protein [Dehalococcoidales bacterium]
MGKKQNEISSISRSVQILLCLSRGINSLTEIASYCNYDKPTVHRLLKALEAADMVVQDPLNRKYFLGKLVPLLAINPRNIHWHLISNSIGEMNRLSDLTEETIVLGIHIGIQFVSLHSIPSQHELRVTEQIQLTGPPYTAGAMGRVLFSQHADSEIKALLSKLVNESQGDQKVKTEEFMERINLIRRHGYDISYSEVVDGVAGIAAPLKNYSYPGGLSIIGPEKRLKTREAELIKEIKISSNRISNILAGSISKVDLNI